MFKNFLELFVGNGPSNRRYHLFLLSALAAIVVIRVITIGMYPLMDKTEARYAEIAREMVVTNNWVTPQLEPGQPFWGKPPLSFWLTALSYKVFGINEFSARFPSVVLALLTAYFTFLLARRMKNTMFGLSVLLVLSTTGLFFINAGSVMTDPSLAASIALSMTAFYMAFNSEKKLFRKLWGYLVFVGLGLSFLAKGPVGWVLIGIPLFIWCLWHNQWRDLFKNLPWISGFLLTLCIALPWYFLAEARTPGFLEYFFIGEHWQRFTVSDWRGDLYGTGHGQPKGMIWLFALPAMMPWAIIFFPLLGGLFKSKKIGRNKTSNIWMSYLILWFISPMILFTFASNILVPYIVPGLPAFAILVVLGLGAFTPDDSALKVPWFCGEKTIIVIAAFVPVFVLISTLTFLPKIGENQSQIKMAEIFNTLSTDAQGSLIYLQDIPHSADFYSKGRAREILYSSKDEILKELGDDNEDFFVSEKTYNPGIFKEFFDLTQMVGENEEYAIYKEKRQ